jgi:filamentous hemagglutinin family protein
MKHSLNHAYRLVWNDATGAYVPVAETTRARGKRASGAVLAAASGLTLALAAQSASALGAGTLPGSGNIAAGRATLTQSGNTLNVAQSSQKLVIDWGSFDIGSAASVNFDQASKNAIALNRVGSGTASQIDGALTANGNVWVLNSAGVVFGGTAQVNVGGLVASSLNLTDSDFLAGRYTFTDGGAAGAVRNAGSINAAGGVVALVAPVVGNTGTISASSVALAAGGQVTLDFGGDGLLAYTIDRAALGALVDNGGSISGNSVSLSARSAGQAVATVVNNDGVIEATGLSERGGHIVLDGGDNGAVHVSGRLDASSASAEGGSITVTGRSVALDGGARLAATGATGGGTIRVGGGLHGEDAGVANAQTVNADASVSADASATANGKGGEVVFWSDDTTRFAGKIDIRGGASGGDGGTAEVSGKQVLHYSGTTDALAPHGATGDLLLDPTNITILAGAATGDITGSAVTVADLEAQTANVTLQAGGSSGGFIHFNDLNLNGGDGTLTMHDNVGLRLEVTSPSNASTGSITFDNAANTIQVSGTGYIYMQAGTAGGGTIGTASVGVPNLVALGTGNSADSAAAVSSFFTGAATVGSGTPGAGSISILGADGITLGGAISTQGGYVRLWADSDNAGGGGMVVNQPIATAGGNLYIAAGNNTNTIALNSDMTLGSGRLFFHKDGTQSAAPVTLNGLLNASGEVDITTNFTMGGNASIYTDGDIVFGAVNLNLNTGSGVLVLRANAIDWGAATLTNLSTASIRLEPYDPATGMVLGDSSGFASATTLAKLPGIQNLTIGRSDGTGTITVSTGFGFNAWGSFELEDRNINVAAALTNTTGNVTLTGDHVSITDTVTASTSTGSGHAAGTAGAGKVTIRQMTAADQLFLGSGLDSSSVGQIHAATLELGRTDGGNLIFNNDIATIATSVALLSGAQVLGVAGGVSATNLAISAGGGATISSPTFNFDTLALATGAGSTSSVTSSTANWKLGTVDGYTGLNLGAGSSTTLTAAGTLDLNAGSVDFHGGATSLSLDADVFAGTASVANQGAASVAFDQVDHGTPLTVGASGSVLPGTTLTSFNGTKDITIGSAQADVVTAAALAVTTAAGGTLALVGDSLAVPFAVAVTTGSLTLDSGSALDLDAALTASSGTVTLDTSNRDITGSGVITANRLVIASGTGDATLSAVQQVNSLSASADSLTLQNGRSLTVNGIAVDKTVDLRLSGASADLTLAGAVTAGNADAAATPILLAAGRNFVNNAGSAAVSAGSGRWLVYSTSPLADTRGGLAPDFKQYAATLSGAVLGSANGFLYTVAPTLTVGLAGTTGKVYDGTTAATLGAGNYTASGAIDGDAVGFSAGGASYDTRNVGTGKTVTASGLALTGASNGGVAVYGYALNGTTASGAIGSVTPRTISADTVDVQTKTYDGTATATLDGTLAGTVGGDDVSVGGSATYSDKNVGTGKAVAVSGLTLAGSDAGNYVLASTSGTSTGDITAKTITAGAVGVASKTYDGTTVANVSGGALSGIVGSDTVSTTLSGTYADKNVGTGKSVDVALGLSGTDAGNYVLASTSGTSTGDITAKTITAGAVGVASKTYDGTTVANVSGGALSGVVGGDTVSTTLSGAYADKNVGTGKSVDVALGLGGTDAGNYVLASNRGTGTGDITAKTITAGAVDVASKTYDGTTVANVSGGGLSGVVAGDTVSTTLSGAYADKNAGIGKSVDVSLGLGGADAGNYILADTHARGTGDIDAKTLMAGAVAVITKTYGGTTTANVIGGALSGVVAGDDVTTTLSGTYDNAAAGTSKTVTVQLGLKGGDAANYHLGTTQETVSGDIAVNPASDAVTALQAATGSSNGTQGSSAAGDVGGSNGAGSTLLPGATGRTELYGSGDPSLGSGSGSGSNSSSGGTASASSGGASSSTLGATSTSGKPDTSSMQGGGSGVTAPAVQLSSEGEFRTADGVSIDTSNGNGNGGNGNGNGGNAGGSGDNPVQSSLTVYTADTDMGLRFQGEYHVVDQGSSLSLQEQHIRQGNDQPQLNSPVSVRLQATLPLGNGDTGVLQLTLLADGILLVQGDAGLGSLGQDTLSAYALSALKASAGVGADKVKAVVLRIGAKG